ncbi:hypothetical protein LPTSP3_g17840 [Leptospira kobayashii]|uniref:Uncharacterized protein n=1 Tax=Leptospira kobayashii TaxID=1917830 RepID=A0ABM7UJ97_9LEPT|nr:hypothetical protein [Leptospira kobayashii]BDA78854.1 hypothetical protein LPTSP3_g17840 [Leptospira kobayashii]
MLKTYSGERIPGTVNYHVYVHEGKNKRPILINNQLKWEDLRSDSDLGLRNEILYRICLAILFDYSGNLELTEFYFRDFKKNIERLLCEDHWLIHSARIEAFLESIYEEGDNTTESSDPKEGNEKIREGIKSRVP